MHHKRIELLRHLAAVREACRWLEHLHCNLKHAKVFVGGHGRVCSPHLGSAIFRIWLAVPLAGLHASRVGHEDPQVLPRVQAEHLQLVPEGKAKKNLIVPKRLLADERGGYARRWIHERSVPRVSVARLYAAKFYCGACGGRHKAHLAVSTGHDSKAPLLGHVQLAVLDEFGVQLVSVASQAPAEAVEDCRALQELSDFRKGIPGTHPRPQTERDILVVLHALSANLTIKSKVLVLVLEPTIRIELLRLVPELGIHRHRVAVKIHSGSLGHKELLTIRVVQGEVL
mmetsp:Transcript_24651/g.78722  ORF Transcript_24651/g.78722 Transcript_24651/m.78722 type:complete len:285 (+) Transcript_24651:846-1700(+)